VKTSEVGTSPELPVNYPLFSISVMIELLMVKLKADVGSSINMSLEEFLCRTEAFRLHFHLRSLLPTRYFKSKLILHCLRLKAEDVSLDLLGRLPLNPPQLNGLVPLGLTVLHLA
jgi:hypothetical protein